MFSTLTTDILPSTPFGLYRDGTELRGLYYAKPEVARAACDSLGSKCDYPVLVGNDQLYGGLGGEFVCVCIVSDLLEEPQLNWIRSGQSPLHSSMGH